jgi:hypothetical protein
MAKRTHALTHSRTPFLTLGERAAYSVGLQTTTKPTKPGR